MEDRELMSDELLDVWLVAAAGEEVAGGEVAEPAMVEEL